MTVRDIEFLNQRTYGTQCFRTFGFDFVQNLLHCILLWVKTTHALVYGSRMPIHHGISLAASLQVEGAERQGGRGESIWDVFSRIPGTMGSNIKLHVHSYA